MGVKKKLNHPKQTTVRCIFRGSLRTYYGFEGEIVFSVDNVFILVETNTETINNPPPRDFMLQVHEGSSVG